MIDYVAMIKVSVIVATYRSGSGLDRVVASIDAQRLPASEFEVLFIDDGSGDDTVERLLSIAATRPNVHVHEIPHSGWPSRPRNTGIDLARGEFVLFMDHDDALYPDALSEAWEFARRHDVDIVNAKEVTHGPDPGWSWLEYDSDRVVAPDDPLQLVPLMPHKLYRRSMLLEHDVRFREGRDVHWEDRLFNVDAFVRSRRIGVLSSSPFYQWHHTGRNNSASYVGDPRQWDLSRYWPIMVELFDHFASVLPERPLFVLRRNEYLARVLLTWASPRILGLGRPLVEESWRHMTTFVERHAPPEVDAGLPIVARARSHLLRAGLGDLVWQLAEEDRRVWARTSVADVGVDVGGRLVIRCTTRWRVSGRGDLRLRRVGARLHRDLPVPLLEALPEELIDVTDEVPRASSTLAVRLLDEHAVFPLATQSEPVLTQDDGDDTGLEVRATAVVDPRDAIVGRPMPDGVWQVATRCDALGHFHRKSLRAGRGRVVLSHGRAMVTDRDADGYLLIRVGRRVPELLVAAGARRVGPASISVERLGLWGCRLTVHLDSVSVAGTTSLPARIVLVGRRRRQVLPARLVGDHDGARIEAAGRLMPGRYAIGLRYGGGRARTSAVLSVGPTLRARVREP